MNSKHLFSYGVDGMRSVRNTTVHRFSAYREGEMKKGSLLSTSHSTLQRMEEERVQILREIQENGSSMRPESKDIVNQK